MNLLPLLHYGKQKNASDLHLSAGNIPMLRIDGDLFPITPAEIIRTDDVSNAFAPYLSEQQQQTFSTHHDIDFTFITDAFRCRVNLFQQLHGVSAVMRYIPNTIPTLDDLHAPAVFKDIIQEPHGLVLVTGPTGSGKSTTLAAMIHEINQTRSCHILTIEDPIEFIHTSRKSIITQRQLHAHTECVNQALRSCLRADPNIILIGELRDAETIRLALTAAETGHLVFATVHTSSAIHTIHRIVDVFPGNEKSMVRSMLSESLNTVIAQTLMKKPGGGRTAIHEIMRVTPAIRNLIREDKIPQIYSAMQTGAHFGMMTKEQSEIIIRNAYHATT